jgi:hypothetical protein
MQTQTWKPTRPPQPSNRLHRDHRFSSFTIPPVKRCIISLSINPRFRESRMNLLSQFVRTTVKSLLCSLGSEKSSRRPKLRLIRCTLCSGHKLRTQNQASALESHSASGHFHDLGCSRQSEAKGRAPFGVGCRTQTATVRFHDRTANR